MKGWVKRMYNTRMYIKHKLDNNINISWPLGLLSLSLDIVVDVKDINDGTSSI